jgi:hypothetical protein
MRAFSMLTGIKKPTPDGMSTDGKADKDLRTHSKKKAMVHPPWPYNS